MKLFKVEATYINGRGQKIPFNFYVISEDAESASDKISKSISDSPTEFESWYLTGEPEELASNGECSETNDLLII